MRRQMIEQFYFLVHAKRRPCLHDGIESAGRIHEKRRPGADHLVARDDAVDDRGGHSALAGSGPSPLFAHATAPRITGALVQAQDVVAVKALVPDLHPRTQRANGG